MRAITLIGMSGAGKSAVSKVLASQTGGRYIDTDELIERQSSRKLQDILDEKGDEDFVILEARVVTHLSIQEGDIIATGGSIILSENAISHLAESSVVVHLHVPFEEIEKRIGKGEGRGIVGLRRKNLRQLYEERLPQYERFAAHTVDAAHALPEVIAERVLSELGNVY